jgi:hypothetical protein
MSNTKNIWINGPLEYDNTHIDYSGPATIEQQIPFSLIKLPTCVMDRDIRKDKLALSKTEVEKLNYYEI